MGKSHFLRFRIVILYLFLFSVFATRIEGQYFGQNKVQYDHFKFNVLKTGHFQIYFYDEEKDSLNL